MWLKETDRAWQPRVENLSGTATKCMALNWDGIVGRHGIASCRMASRRLGRKLAIVNVPTGVYGCGQEGRPAILVRSSQALASALQSYIPNQPPSTLPK